jgi:hypothetical protein
MSSEDLKRSIGVVIGQGKQEDPISFAALMVHVDVEHDSEQRVELAIGLADRFQAALIGVAGCALWPAFMAGDVGLTKFDQYEFQKVMVRFEQRGKKLHAQGRSLRQIEWRSVLETPGELLMREARAADLLIIGRRRSENDADPGVIVLRAGRPVLLVPDTVAALPLRRVVVAWVAGQEESGRCRRLSCPPSRDRGGRSLATSAGIGRHRAPARCAGGERRSNRRRRLWAQPIGRMDFRRRHARASNGKPDLLHIVSLTFASSTTAAARRALDCLRFFQLFDHKIPFARDHVTTQPGASHFTDMLRDMRFPLHKDVQIAGVEHEQACSHEGGNGRGSARPPQYRDFTEEMTGAEPNALVLELDLHFSGRDEIHGMSALAALGDNVSSLDLLRAQKPHDVGDIRCLKFGEQGYARDHTPSDDKVATMDLVGEGRGDDADRQGDHNQSDEDRNRCDDASQHGHRNDIAITDSAERDDGPPHRIGNGAEFIGLRVAFDHVHDACGEQRRAQ